MSDKFIPSEEEKRILAKHKKLVKKAQTRNVDFWEKKYRNLSRDEKINYWLANIHHGMRLQGESTGDSYSEFSIEWYLDIKKKEPEFDEIFKQVVAKLGFDFDWKKYEQRIVGKLDC